MRKHILEAKIYEEKNDPKDAIYAYIAGLKNNENFSDDELLDAIVLFFMAQEYAFIREYALDNEIQDLAWNYYDVALNKISKSNKEVIFWKHYIPFILLNEKMLNNTEIQRLLENDDTAVIYILANHENNISIKDKVNKLHEKHKLGKTERSRYINSIINSFPFLSSRDCE